MEFYAHFRLDCLQSGVFSVFSHVEVSHLSGMSKENPLDVNSFAKSDTPSIPLSMNSLGLLSCGGNTINLFLKIKLTCNISVFRD